MSERLEDVGSSEKAKRAGEVSSGTKAARAVESYALGSRIFAMDVACFRIRRLFWGENAVDMELTPFLARKAVLLSQLLPDAFEKLIVNGAREIADLNQGRVDSTTRAADGENRSTAFFAGCYDRDFVVGTVDCIDDVVEIGLEDFVYVFGGEKGMEGGYLALGVYCTATFCHRFDLRSADQAI